MQEGQGNEPGHRTSVAALGREDGTTHSQVTLRAKSFSLSCLSWCKPHEEITNMRIKGYAVFICTLQQSTVSARNLGGGVGGGVMGKKLAAFSFLLLVIGSVQDGLNLVYVTYTVFSFPKVLIKFSNILLYLQSVVLLIYFLLLSFINVFIIIRLFPHSSLTACCLLVGIQDFNTFHNPISDDIRNLFQSF